MLEGMAQSRHTSGRVQVWGDIRLLVKLIRRFIALWGTQCCPHLLITVLSQNVCVRALSASGLRAQLLLACYRRLPCLRLWHQHVVHWRSVP
jgi:hypothetical protein